MVGIWAMLRSMRKSVHIATIARDLDDGSRPTEDILDELLHQIRIDRSLQDIVASNNVSRDDLLEMFWLLMANGAGQIAADHFVAASALAYPATLRYCIRCHRNKTGVSWRQTSYELVEYFSSGETGEVRHL